jgi:hypothetical protein
MATTHIPPATASDETPSPSWSIESARELYNIEGWGAGYFDVNEKGHVVVRPDRDRPDRALDLFDLARDLEEQGVALPVLLRFSDILQSRIESLSERFEHANASLRVRKGIGLATFMHGAGFTGSGEDHLASVVAIEASADGRVRVLSSNTEIGQGTNTVFAQIAADALGMPIEAIEIARPDTAVVPDSGPTVASRTCMVVGGLVEHLLRHRYGVGKLLEIEEREFLRRGHRYYLVI